MKDPIVESIIERFKERSDEGIKKYGVTMARKDLSSLEWLIHLQEELMDAILYAEKLKEELKKCDAIVAARDIAESMIDKEKERLIEFANSFYDDCVMEGGSLNQSAEEYYNITFNTKRS